MREGPRAKIRLLGPVEVEVAGRTVDIGPRQRRTVLAALAVEAGTPVTIDTLAERVWATKAPEAPRSALYAHVTRLRQALAAASEGDAEPIGLSRHGDGYVLEVDRRRVDLHHLRELVDTGQAARQGEAGERIAALREAMNLWRGQPLSTLASQWVVRARRGIESQLINVARAWAAEELRLGNAQVVADRLAHTVAVYPLAEPLVALHMRALCALGRASEALECYAEIRTQIAEQLGAEPGSELRQLHVAVLRGELDETGRASAVSVDTPRRPPRQLPADIVRFPVRVTERNRIIDWLTTAGEPAPTPVVGVYGRAGVGKSTLVIHTAHRLVDRYPDGQLYLDLRGYSVGSAPLSPEDALARLLRTLGVATSYAPAQIDEAAALFRSLVAGRRLLVVLDNAADAAQVRPLLPSGPGCATLVTSRQPLAGLGDGRQVRIGALTVDEAVGLLGHWVGVDRVAAEPQAAAAIAHWCEYLPLALRIASVRLLARPTWPLAELQARLADERRRLDNLEFDGVGLRASMAGSYQRLLDSADLTERATAEAFKLLGACGQAEFNRSAVARLLARSELHAERLLERLVDVQLLETSAPGTYWMGDLLRLYARERFAELPA